MRLIVSVAAAIALCASGASADDLLRTGSISFRLYGGSRVHGAVSVDPGAGWKVAKTEREKDQIDITYEAPDGSQCAVQAYPDPKPDKTENPLDAQEGQDFQTDYVMDQDVKRLLALARKSGGVVGQRRWDVVRSGAGEYDYWIAYRTVIEGRGAVVSHRQMSFGQYAMNASVTCTTIGAAPDPGVGGDMWKALTMIGPMMRF